MNRQVPTLGKLLTMVIFALSCFGLTLFLWVQFGGSIPFKAQGYRITATFPEATSLATEADVRIAGVGIGRVKKVLPGADGRAIATLEIEPRFAPLPVGTKAILRQKTLLGETYVSLTPPLHPSGRLINEGGRIPNGDIGSTVELDELFATFNPETRRYFQEWMQNAGKGLNGRGGDGGKALVELQMLISNLKDVTTTLDDQTPSLQSGLRDAKNVLNASTAQQGALRQAIVETDRVFKQTGDQEAALTAFTEKLPKFLAATKTGTKAIENFATSTGPAVTRLEPTAKSLAPATKALASAAPEIRQLLEGVQRVNANAKLGLPAVESTLQVLPVLLDPLDPFLKQVNPITEYASLYGGQIAGALGNLTGASQASVGTNVTKPTREGVQRAVRGAVVLQTGGLAASNKRFSTEQGNAYRQPTFAGQVGRGLPDAYSRESCGTTVPRIPNSDNAALAQLGSVGASPPLAVPDVSALDAIRYSLFGPLGYYQADATQTTPQQVPAPTTPAAAPADCTLQSKFNLTAGRLTTYPQLPAAPTSTERSVTGN